MCEPRSRPRTPRRMFAAVALLCTRGIAAFTLGPYILRRPGTSSATCSVESSPIDFSGAGRAKSATGTLAARDCIALRMMPNPEELRQQKAEALQSLADFNDGSWSGRATSFSVTSDVAAGVTKRKLSRPYTTSVSTQFGLGGDGLKMVETFQWQSEGGDDGGGTCVSARTAKLGKSTDVDAVDGSYSTDSALLDMPSAVTGTDALVKFAIEHSLAVNDHERVRCFILYGIEDQLVRVVLCDETRVNDAAGAESAVPLGSTSARLGANVEGDFTSSSMNEEDEMAADIDRLVGKITGEVVAPKSEPRSSPSVSAQGIKDPITADSTIEERMERLQKAFDDAKRSQGDEFSALASNQNVRLPVDLYSLSMGVWLGDAVVRDQGISAAISEGKGFGVAAKARKKSFGEGFAEWSMGVQKVAMTFKWDFEEIVRHVINWGRSMGSHTDEAMPSSSMGVVNDELMSRRLKPEERMLYIDYDMGKYAGFVVGSVYVKAPRYLTFSQLKNSAFPFFTEFAVFQRRADKAPETELDSVSGDNTELPEVFCSRMTRLYNSEGKLTQGSTSFFTMQQTSGA